MWIFDTVTRERRRVADLGNYVSWAEFDDNLYIWETPEHGPERVMRFDPSRGVVEPTSHHSIYFSPSGDYYFKPVGVFGREDVYWRESNQSLTRVSRTFANLSGLAPQWWAPDRDILMLTAETTDGTQVRLLYDPAMDSAVRVPLDSVVGWGRTGDEVLTISGNSVSLRAVSEVRIKD